MPATRRDTSDIAIVHSSDLHVDDGYTARAWGGDGNAPLAAVLATAAELAADLVLLTGDVFEHNRLPGDLLKRTADILEAAPCPVVLLPGNHDPMTPGSVWERGAFADIEDIHVFDEATEIMSFADFDLDIWGRAHLDYGDMAPLADTPPRSAARHVVTGHGHYVDERPAEGELAPSWLIPGDDVEATGADYVALGHWNVTTRVGNGAVPAWYSGSPDLAKTVNLVRLTAAGKSHISHEKLVVMN